MQIPFYDNRGGLPRPPARVSLGRPKEKHFSVPLRYHHTLPRRNYGILRPFVNTTRKTDNSLPFPPTHTPTAAGPQTACSYRCIRAEGIGDGR